MKRRSAPVATDQSGITRALLYRRVSGAKHQRDGVSLETQQLTLRAYVVRQEGWVVDSEYVDIMSGKRADRPGYVAMLARFGRRVLEYLNRAEELTKAGVVIHTTETGAELDEEWTTMKMLWAQKEGKLIGKRVAENRRTVVDKGWPYGRIAFGYRPRRPTDAEIAAGCRPTMNMIEPEPGAREVVGEIFDRVARGDSIGSAVSWLASLSPERRGYRSWAQQSLMKLLESPTYVARPTAGDDDVLARPPARWKPLVTDATWAGVQERLELHDRRPHPGMGRVLLTGFMRCDRCGYRMAGVSYLGGKHAYRCTSKALGANAPVADCYYTVPMHTSDSAVLDVVAGILEVFERSARPRLRDAWQRMQQRSTSTDGNGRRLAQLDREESTAKHELAKAGRLLVNGVDRVVFEALRDEQLQHLERIAAERERLGAARMAPSPRLPSLDTVLSSAGGWSAVLRGVDLQLQRQVLDPLVASVRMRRVGFGAYEVEVSWTEVGQWLVDLNAQVTQDAA